MVKKILYRRQPSGRGYVVQMKKGNKWVSLDKHGVESEDSFWYRNEYLADLNKANFEQSTDILPESTIGPDTELQVD